MIQFLQNSLFKHSECKTGSPLKKSRTSVTLQNKYCFCKYFFFLLTLPMYNYPSFVAVVVRCPVCRKIQFIISDFPLWNLYSGAPFFLFELAKSLIFEILIANF